mgnify:CR=1 FL=1
MFEAVVVKDGGVGEPFTDTRVSIEQLTHERFHTVLLVVVWCAVEGPVSGLPPHVTLEHEHV